MKKLGFVILALSAISLALPSIASAETVVIKNGGHRHLDRARAEFHPHRDWHPHRHDRVVIVKRHHHD
jgi:hypothetical protein